MPTATALRLCPQAILISGHRGRYSEMSDKVMAILGEYTPLLEPLSIDEAFLDVTGTEAHYGPPAQLARRRCRTASSPSCGLSASLGVATNKLHREDRQRLPQAARHHGRPAGRRSRVPRADADPQAVGRRRGDGA